MNPYAKQTNAQLRASLKAIMEEYARRFCEKYGLQEGWYVADDYVGTYCTDDIDMSLDASNIVFCVDNGVDGETLGSWWNYVLENEYSSPINLRSWVEGMRPEMMEI